jgi:MYND finger
MYALQRMLELKASVLSPSCIETITTLIQRLTPVENVAEAAAEQGTIGSPNSDHKWSHPALFRVAIVAPSIHGDDDDEMDVIHTHAYVDISLEDGTVEHVHIDSFKTEDAVHSHETATANEIPDVVLKQEHVVEEEVDVSAVVAPTAASSVEHASEITEDELDDDSWRDVGSRKNSRGSPSLGKEVYVDAEDHDDEDLEKAAAIESILGNLAAPEPIRLAASEKAPPVVLDSGATPVKTETPVISTSNTETISVAGSLSTSTDDVAPADSNDADGDEFKQCEKCQKTGSHLLRCGRCRVIFYCDKTCQQTAWPQHKKTCKPPV